MKNDNLAGRLGLKRAIAPASAGGLGPRWLAGWLACALAGLLAACGGGSETTTSSSPAAATVQSAESLLPSTPESRERTAGDAGDPVRQVQAGAAYGAGLFVDRLNAGEVLTSIRICGGSYVDSVQLTSNQRSFARHGGAGGACQVFNLAEGETVFKVFGAAGTLVDRLGFVTSSGRTLGPVGGAGGTPFGMSASSGPGGGFRGLSGAATALGDLQVLGQINLIGDATGGAGGSEFIDRMLPDEKVVDVVICYRSDSFVQSVQLRTDLGKRSRHGTDVAGLPCSSTRLAEGEFIRELFGTADQYLNSLGFVTSSGRRVGPFGGPGGKEFSQTVAASGRFVGWYGRSGVWLDRIGLMTPASDGSSNTSFADQLPAGERIGAIEVCTADGFNNRVVRSVRALLASGRSLPLNGGRADADLRTQCQRIDFAAGEFVIEMFGNAGQAVDSLGFRTSTGRDIGPFGGSGGSPFVLRNPSTSAFLGFAGRFAYDGPLQSIDFGAPDLFPPVPAADADAARLGWWGEMASWPLNAIHASVLPDGRVFSYGTDASGTQGAQFIYDVWDPAQGAGSTAHLTLPNTAGTDLFCNAQTLLPNGQVLLAGGDNRQQTGGYNRGVRDVNLFTPATNALQPTVKLLKPRWYATQTLLPSGRVLAVGGIDDLGQGVNVAEVYTAGQGWKPLSSAVSGWLANFYPRVFVPPQALSANNGDQVFLIPTGTNRIFRLDVDANAGQGALVDTGVLLPSNHDWQMPATQFAPGKSLLQLKNGSTVVVQWPRAAGQAPVVSASGSLSQARYWASFVVLPTGEVLATGGSAADNTLTQVATHAEIWNPGTGVWRRAASEMRPRLYHATAVLLPDGRVLSSGGGSPGPVINLNAQPYSPPYLFTASGALASRPQIGSAPASLGYNSARFSVQSAQAASIRRATLTRLNSTTHAFDFDAHFMELNIVQRSSSALVLQGPATAFALPPGPYLLTVIDTAGVPSVSKVVNIR